jgi:TolB-like protein/DNA-binding winged helix-turn-helix (wHTH) protein/Tfp pilus assembly protein PilF
VLAGRTRTAYPAPVTTSVRFADFELDLRTGELRRRGATLKLQRQPAKVLSLLVSRAGEVVTRQELAQQVWGSETYVDFEQGLNFAIRQIRTALEDDANNPKFLETLPKRGYRFIGTVSEFSAVDEIAPSGPSAPPAAVTPFAKGAPRYVLALLAIAAVALAIVFGTRGLLHSKVAASTESFRSVAVLPLRNLSSDPDQEYFSDGITDELITELAKIPSLHVISHTSVQRYKNTKLSLQEIAQELHADAVIEGSILRSGDRVRITAQLIDGRTDQHLWAEEYERDFRDVLKLQSEVAQQIAIQVGVNLTVNERARLAQTVAVDPAAHEAYLKGHFYWDKLTCTGFKQSLQYYQQAADKDPTFTRAFVGIADAYYNLGDWGCSPQTEAFAKSRAAALQAVKLDPAIAPAYAELADLDFTAEWNWPKAEKEYQQALQLDPSDAGTHTSYAIFLIAMGRRDQAIAEMKKAHEIDPVSEITNMLGTYVLYLAHQYNQAEEQGKKTLELYPNSRATDYWMGHIYEQKHMPREAFDSYLKSNSGTPADFAALHTAFEKDGLRGFWMHQLNKSEKKPDWPCWKAMFYGHTGDNERAMQMLQQSFDHHCDGLQFLKTNPVFDPLQTDPRYQELISKLKL